MATLEKKRGAITGFNFSEKECVWMRAKVVSTKYCDNAFDCNTCAFDKGMQKKMARESYDAGWSSKMFALATEEQRCRHALTGRVPSNKMCARSYECGDCPFDQMLDDMIQVDHTLFGPPQYLNAHGYLVPRDYYLHGGHGWARVEYGGRVRIGLDDFGNRLVGRVDKFRLPSLGTRLKVGDESFTLARESHEAGVRTPLTGVVTAVNQKLLDHPECSNADPYSGGWVMLVDPMELKSDLKELYFGVDSVRFVESEAERLLSLVVGDDARAAALGGEPLPDIYGAFRELGWENLVKKFI
jgi:glycine cleavage system H lipoate-binding protein